MAHVRDSLLPLLDLVWRLPRRRHIDTLRMFVVERMRVEDIGAIHGVIPSAITAEVKITRRRLELIRDNPLLRLRGDQSGAPDVY